MGRSERPRPLEVCQDTKTVSTRLEGLNRQYKVNSADTKGVSKVAGSLHYKSDRSRLNVPLPDAAKPRRDVAVPLRLALIRSMIVRRPTKEDRSRSDVRHSREARDLRHDRIIERDSPTFWNLRVGEMPAARPAMAGFSFYMEWKEKGRRLVTSSVHARKWRDACKIA